MTAKEIALFEKFLEHTSRLEARKKQVAAISGQINILRKEIHDLMLEVKAEKDGDGPLFPREGKKKK